VSSRSGLLIRAAALGASILSCTRPWRRCHASLASTPWQSTEPLPAEWKSDSENLCRVAKNRLGCNKCRTASGCQYIAQMFKEYGVTHVFKNGGHLRMAIREMEVWASRYSDDSEHGAGYMADDIPRSRPPDLPWGSHRRGESCGRHSRRVAGHDAPDCADRKKRPEVCVPQRVSGIQSRPDV
jgi:hypothetical protein